MRAAHRSRHHSQAALVAIGALAAGAAAGCGSRPAAELPPAAQPVRSPRLGATAEGRVIPVTRALATARARPTLEAAVGRGDLVVALLPRRRELALLSGRRGTSRDRIPVGVGPTQVACARSGPCYVVDTTGDALLVVRVAPDSRTVRLTRRVYLAGAPYAIAVDRARRRIWVTLTARNELVELAANARPHLLRRHPTVQQPNGVEVDERSGDVLVTGARPPRLQRLTHPATPDRP